MGSKHIDWYEIRIKYNNFNNTKFKTTKTLLEFLYEKYENFKSIAIEVEVSYPTVRRKMKELGIVCFNRNIDYRYIRWDKHKYLWEERTGKKYKTIKDFLIAAYKETESLRKISKILKVSESALSRKCKELGIDVLTAKQRKNSKHKKILAEYNKTHDVGYTTLKGLIQSKMRRKKKRGEVYQELGLSQNDFDVICCDLGLSIKDEHAKQRILNKGNSIIENRYTPNFKCDFKRSPCLQCTFLKYPKDNQYCINCTYRDYYNSLNFSSLCTNNFSYEKWVESNMDGYCDS